MTTTCGLMILLQDGTDKAAYHSRLGEPFAIRGDRVAAFGLQVKGVNGHRLACDLDVNPHELLQRRQSRVTLVGMKLAPDCRV